MSRALTSTDSDAVLSDCVGVVQFLEIDWPWGTSYLTDADGPYTWGSNTYTPGEFGSVSNIFEGADGSPRPTTITVSGLDSTVVQDAISEKICWISIVYTIGFIGSDNVLLDTPSLSWTLNLGDCTIALDKNSGTITITAESQLADLQGRTSGCLATMADQQKRFSSDTYFMLLSAIQDRQIYWGQYGPNQVGITANYQYVKPPAGGYKMIKP